VNSRWQPSQRYRPIDSFRTAATAPQSGHEMSTTLTGVGYDSDR